MIYTIGYATITVTEIIEVMSSRRIGLLVDVRSIPYTRLPHKYEFNRNQLSRLVPYLWKGDVLGGKEGPAKEEGITWLVLKEEEGVSILLLCVESDPRKCHRYYDIAVRLLERGIEAFHLWRPRSGAPLQEVTTTELNKEKDHG